VVWTDLPDVQVEQYRDEHRRCLVVTLSTTSPDRPFVTTQRLSDKDTQALHDGGRGPKQYVSEQMAEELLDTIANQWPRIEFYHASTAGQTRPVGACARQARNAGYSAADEARRKRDSQAKTGPVEHWSGEVEDLYVPLAEAFDDDDIEYELKT